MGQRGCSLARLKPSPGLHCLSAFGLFGTGFEWEDAPAGEYCLHCLSAFGLFGTKFETNNNGQVVVSLHCLSAFGLFGTFGDGEKGQRGFIVFIAFRLLVCLGQRLIRVIATEKSVSSLPFGFWSVWDGATHHGVVPPTSSLHCLSAFGLFGTDYNARKTLYAT